jgi:hypothetical protein
MRGGPRLPMYGTNRRATGMLNRVGLLGYKSMRRLVAVAGLEVKLDTNMRFFIAMMYSLGGPSPRLSKL